MKKIIMLLLLIIVCFFNINVYAEIDNIICIYKNVSTVLYFQQDDYPYNGFRIYAINMTKPKDIYDEQWYHNNDNIIPDYEYVGETEKYMDENNRYFKDCPEYLGYDIDNEIIYFNTTFEYDDDNNKYTKNIETQYKLEEKLNIKWNDVLEKINNPASGEAVELKCHYLEEKYITLEQNKSGQLSLTEHNYDKTQKCIVDDTEKKVDNIIFDKTNAKLNSSGYLEKCPDRLAYYYDDGQKNNVIEFDIGKYFSDEYSKLCKKTSYSGELPEIKHCNSLLGNPKCNGKSEDPECLNKNATPAYYMSIVFRLMRWAAIILLIVMSILEFTGSTASGDEDQLQKVIKRTGIRLGLCVLIFLLPYLIDYLLSLLDQAGISDCVNIK